MWQGMETPMIHLTYGLVFDFKGFKRPVRNVFLATRRKRMVHIRVFPPSIIVNHQCLWWKGPALRGKNLQSSRTSSRSLLRSFSSVALRSKPGDPG